MASWLHPANLERTVVESKLKAAGGDNGTFLVRKRPAAGEYVLSVTFRGKPTHHLIAPDAASKKLFIMKKNLCNASNINQMVSALSKMPMPKGWPVQLKLGVNKDGSSSAPKADGGGGGSVKAKGSVRSRGSTGGASTKAKPWMSTKPMSKEAATAHLAKNAPAGKDGVFFVRPRGGESKTDYVVCVTYKGKPTHHLVSKKEGKMTINNKPTTATNISQLVTVLRKKQPFWPVPLIEYVKQGGGSAKLGDAAANRKSTASNDGGDSGGGGGGGGGADWLHDAMPKEACTALMKKHKKTKEGNFFIRKRGPDNPDDYVVCVVYKGKPTHHLCTKQGGKFLINKAPTGKSTIEDVVELLRSKQRFWPIPLTDHVPNGKGGGGGGGGGSAKKSMKKRSSVKKKKEVEKEPEPEPEPEPEKPLTPEEIAAKKAADDAAAAKAAEEKRLADIEAAKKKAAEEKAKRLLADPHKLWVEGQKLDIKIVRTDLSRGFGFGLASKFRIEGRAKVISFVDPKGPAADVLKIGDEILAVCEEPIFELELGDLKELIRDMDLTFDARIFRPSKLVAKDPPKLEAKIPDDWETPLRAKARQGAGTVWEYYGKDCPGDVKMRNQALRISMKVAKPKPLKKLGRRGFGLRTNKSQVVLNQAYDGPNDVMA